MMPTGRYFGHKTHMWPHLNVSGRQCCQLAEISATKNKSGRLKISAAEFWADFLKNGRKMAELS
jgi:hypothetical protein